MRLLINAGRSPLNENGLVCQGRLRGHGNSEAWFTCDEYMKPLKPIGEEKRPGREEAMTEPEDF